MTLGLSTLSKSPFVRKTARQSLFFFFFKLSMHCIIAPSILRTDEAVISVFRGGAKATSARVCASLQYVSEKS